MANSGPNDNRSQFFITLAPTPELQKKNTLFATVVGDSLYNALKLGEGEVDKETERPVYPRKIVTTRVLDSPFTNITVRTNMATTAADTVGSVGANTTKTRKKKAKTVKNKKLLSFADDEDDGDLVVAADSNVELMRAQYKSARSVSKRLKNDSHEDELLARLGRFKSKIRKVGAEEGEQSSV
ncbi:Peptidyl-prolyl isomerase cwc27 [Coemansia sp. RSA 1933]|nr:Peptidyl-prolyl isomerase cwc27 [Coemansia sp. RSA 1933]